LIKCRISPKNLEEKKYIIGVILGDFLGLRYRLEVKELRDYEIILENNNKLIIRDIFFSKFSYPMEYLAKKNIPQRIQFVENQFTTEDSDFQMKNSNQLTTQE